jgi:hypothetical protein
MSTRPFPSNSTGQPLELPVWRTERKAAKRFCFLSSFSVAGTSSAFSKSETTTDEPPRADRLTNPISCSLNWFCQRHQSEENRNVVHIVRIHLPSDSPQSFHQKSLGTTSIAGPFVDYPSLLQVATARGHWDLRQSNLGLLLKVFTSLSSNSRAGGFPLPACDFSYLP